MRGFESKLDCEARKAATVYSVDEGRKQAFEDGAKWFAEYLGRVLDHGIYENFNGYPYKYIEGLMAKDVREALKHFWKIQPEEPEAPVPVTEET